MKIKSFFGMCYKLLRFGIRDLHFPFSYDKFALKMKCWNCLLIAANPSIIVTIFRKFFESSSDYAVKRLEVRETNLRVSVLAILADDSKMKLRGTRKAVTLMEVSNSDFIFELSIQPRLLPFQYHRTRILDQKAYTQVKYKRDRRVIYSKGRDIAANEKVQRTIFLSGSSVMLLPLITRHSNVIELSEVSRNENTEKNETKWDFDRAIRIRVFSNPIQLPSLPVVSSQQQEHCSTIRH